MNPDDEKVLRIAKEIIVKFIELGRVSPGNFDAHFRSVFWTVKDTIVNAQAPDWSSELSKPAQTGEE